MNHLHLLPTITPDPTLPPSRLAGNMYAAAAYERCDLVELLGVRIDSEIVDRLVATFPAPVIAVMRDIAAERGVQPSWTLTEQLPVGES